MVLFSTSTICNKSCTVYTPPASISFAICRWCDICIFNERNKDVVVVVPMDTFVSTEKTRVWLLWQWKWKARNLLVHHKFSDRLMKITDTDLYSKETLPIHLCLLFLGKMTWTQASQPYKINEFNKSKIMVMIWGRLKFTKQPLF